MTPSPLSPDDLQLIRDALGLGMRKSTRATIGRSGSFNSPRGAWRNRSHAYFGGEIYNQHMRLVFAGLLIDDRAADYGKISIFRVTPKGAAAVGLLGYEGRRRRSVARLLVEALLFFRRPPDVVGLVIAINVDSIERMCRRRSQP